MVEYTQKMLENWQYGEITDIHAQMMRLTLNIVMKTLFNPDASDKDARDVSRAMEVTSEWNGTKLS